MGTNCNKKTILDKGLISMSLEYIFENINKINFDMEVSASFIEIYNEDLRDLLKIETPSRSILLRELKNGSVTICGIAEIKVNSVDDVLK